MPAMTPMGSTARLWTEKRQTAPDEHPFYVALYDDGNGKVEEIGVSDDSDNLDWLVGSAAAFHRVPFGAPPAAPESAIAEAERLAALETLKADVQTAQARLAGETR